MIHFAIRTKFVRFAVEKGMIYNLTKVSQALNRRLAVQSAEVTTVAAQWADQEADFFFLCN